MEIEPVPSAGWMEDENVCLSCVPALLAILSLQDIPFLAVLATPFVDVFDEPGLI